MFQWIDRVSDDIEDAFGRSGYIMLMGSIGGLLIILLYLLFVILEVDIPEIFNIGALVVVVSWTVGISIILWNRLLQHVWNAFLVVPITWRYMGICIIVAALIFAAAK